MDQRALATGIGIQDIPSSTRVRRVLALSCLLTAIVSCGRDEPAQIPVPPVDQAFLRCAPGGGPAPLQVRFRSRAELDGRALERYRWDYEGDGTFDSDDAVPDDKVFIFEQPGSYAATLEVTDHFGDAHTESCTIEVSSGAPPEAGDPGYTIKVARKMLMFPPVRPIVDLTRVVPRSIDVSSEHARFPRDRAFDGNVVTSWFTASGDAANRGESAFIEVRFPFDVEVETVRIRGNREWPSDFDFLRARIDLFDDDGKVVLSEKTSLPSPMRDLDVDMPRTGVRSVRFTSLDDEGMSPGLAELEVHGPEVSWAEIKTTLLDAAEVTVQMEDEAGGVVRRIVVDELRDAGSYVDPWDGKDEDGQPVYGGTYYAVLDYVLDGKSYRVDPRYSSGGVRYTPSRDKLPSVFRPFEDESLAITFTVPPEREASEILTFIGLFEKDKRFLTLRDRVPFSIGTHTVEWDGLDADGHFAVPPPGDSFLLGLFAYTLPDNAVLVEVPGPVISNVSITPNYYDPATPTFLEPGGRVAEVYYDLDRQADVELTVLSLDTGRTLRAIVVEDVAAGAGRVIEWDGRSDGGIFVDKGDYRLALRAVDDWGNRSLVYGVVARVFY